LPYNTCPWVPSASKAGDVKKAPKKVHKTQRIVVTVAETIPEEIERPVSRRGFYCDI
jgi:hypothetical protein